MQFKSHQQQVHNTEQKEEFIGSVPELETTGTIEKIEKNVRK